MDNHNTDRSDKIAEFMLTPETAAELAGNRAQTMFCRKNAVTELSSDFTLPDYLPEIRKMLRVSSHISPLSRYIGGNNVEFSGHVDYNLLYSDSDGNLNSALLGNDFSYDVSLDVPPEIEWNDTMEAFADTEADMLHCRVLAPRKVNVKCRLHSNVRAYGTELTDESNISGSDIEKLTMSVPCKKTGRYMSEILEIGDEIVPDGIGTAKPVNCMANVIIAECTAGDGSINCRGDVVLRLLCESSDGNSMEDGGTVPGIISVITRKVPFTQQIDASGVTPDCECSAWGNCGEIKTTADEGKITIDTELIVQADAICNDSVNVTRDLFSTKRECNVIYRDFGYESFLKGGRCKATANATVPVSGTQISAGSRVLDSVGTAKVDNLIFENGKCCMTGTLKVWILAVSPDGKEYSSGEVNVPFECSADCPASATPFGETRINVTECTCRTDGDQLIINAELLADYIFSDKSNVKIVKDASFDKPLTKSASALTVYYPQPDDSLWNIARRYSVSLRTLAELNSLPSVKGDEKVSRQFLIVSR